MAALDQPYILIHLGEPQGSGQEASASCRGMDMWQAGGAGRRVGQAVGGGQG